MLTDTDLLRLHRELVSIPSVSKDEGAIVSFVESWLAMRGAAVERIGNNVVAVTGEQGPLLCLDSHLDTVPPAPDWTRPAQHVDVVDGKVYGLGSNDAKASVAGMLAAFLAIRAQPTRPPLRLLLLLVCEEETGGKGTELVLPELARRGLVPDAAVIGEPTGLDLAVAQKGLLVLELAAHGRACHAAHAHALGATNAVTELARDLLRIESLELGPEHPLLGRATITPTLLSGGTARNMVPARASVILDVRTNPDLLHGDLAARVAAAVSGEVTILSERLKPRAIDPDHPLVHAARAARPEARLYGSRTLSDWVWFDPIPAVKVGPGASERSHIPDEYVLESEVIAGARFYERLVRSFAQTR